MPRILEPFLVGAPLLGLGEGLEQDGDGLVVAPLGGAGEVQRRLAEAAHHQEVAGDPPVHGEPAGPADLLVDHLLDQGMADLVGRHLAAVGFDHEP